MSIFFFTFFICLIAGAVIFLYVQYNIQLNKALGREPASGVSLARRSSPDKTAASPSPNSQWKAVKVKTGLMCCRPAESMRDQLYLVSEAPGFPLENCKAKDCQCRYIQMNDRREGSDRRETTEFLKKERQQQEEERRRKARRQESF